MTKTNVLKALEEKHLTLSDLDEKVKNILRAYVKSTLFDAAYDTWPVTPIFHYSEGVDGTRKHADMPVSFPKDYGRDVLFDCELKNKCQAIFRIRELAAK
jgi:succinate dehydrogenase/fumarate reductase flavoprotein subunit